MNFIKALLAKSSTEYTCKTIAFLTVVSELVPWYLIFELHLMTHQVLTHVFNPHKSVVQVNMAASFQEETDAEEF